jgi:putative DNA primase/helicase
MVEAAPDWTPAAPPIDTAAKIASPRDDRASAPAPKEERRKEADDDDPTHWAIEPWPEPVDGAALLTEMAELIERYMVLPRQAAQAVALWVIHAWTIEVFDISPILAVISPTKRCGKSTLLTILLYLTPRSSPAGNISAAAVYRYVQSKNPTLLLDEADSFMAENEHMRNVMNAGHMRPLAYVIRMEGEGTNMTPKRYSVFGPKVVAAIKELADTIMDRSVKITLRRKQKGERRARLRLRDSEELIDIRGKAMRWAADNRAVLGAMDPEMPETLNDRAADNWRPLVSVAAAAGGEWPKVARDAAVALTGTIEDDDRGTKLLADIRRVFNDTGAMFLTSETLVANLVALEDAPWREWRRDGSPISSRGVAFLLKAFEIRPGEVTRSANGYTREDFETAWDSYL